MVHSFPDSKVAEGGMETLSDHLWLKWLYGYRIGFKDAYRFAGGFSSCDSPPATPSSHFLRLSLAQLGFYTLNSIRDGGTGF